MNGWDYVRGFAIEIAWAVGPMIAAVIMVRPWRWTDES